MGFAIYLVSIEINLRYDVGTSVGSFLTLATVASASSFPIEERPSASDLLEQMR